MQLIVTNDEVVAECAGDTPKVMRSRILRKEYRHIRLPSQRVTHEQVDQVIQVTIPMPYAKVGRWALAANYTLTILLGGKRLTMIGSSVRRPISLHIIVIELALSISEGIGLVSVRPVLPSAAGIDRLARHTFGEVIIRPGQVWLTGISEHLDGVPLDWRTGVEAEHLMRGHLGLVAHVDRLPGARMNELRVILHAVVSVVDKLRKIG